MFSGVVRNGTITNDCEVDWHRDPEDQWEPIDEEDENLFEIGGYYYGIMKMIVMVVMRQFRLRTRMDILHHSLRNFSTHICRD